MGFAIFKSMDLLLLRQIKVKRRMVFIDDDVFFKLDRSRFSVTLFGLFLFVVGEFGEDLFDGLRWNYEVHGIVSGDRSFDVLS
jgi:hypothetical protein